jgi:ubiquinone biosynthesis monooxygenase Coq7
MRVNHAGEISAQALYQAQALTARSAATRTSMKQAAEEENDHLAWCAQRLEELGGHISHLSSIWYLGSFAIGTLAGLAGDKWSLGFLAETEEQVVRHLEAHLENLPSEDHKSRKIVSQMRADESEHATMAVEIGAVALPKPIKKMMALFSKVMTKTAYWV